MDTTAALSEIRTILQKYESDNDQHQGTGHIICHRPHVAPFAYLHYLYPPATAEQIAHVTTLTRRRPRPEFSELLGQCNGLNLYNGSISIYGVRENFDRTDLNIQWYPFDLDVPNILTTQLFGADDMVIGGIGPNVDTLVLRSSGQVDRCLSDQSKMESTVLESWPNLATCLITEVKRFDKHYTAEGYFIEGISVENGKAEPFPDLDLSEIKKPSLISRLKSVFK